MTETPNYHLPIFEQGESPAWLGDWNSTMQKIDQISGGGAGAVDQLIRIPAVKVGDNIRYALELNSQSISLADFLAHYATLGYKSIKIYYGSDLHAATPYVSHIWTFDLPVDFTTSGSLYDGWICVPCHIGGEYEQPAMFSIFGSDNYIGTADGKIGGIPDPNDMSSYLIIMGIK